MPSDATIASQPPKPSPSPNRYAVSKALPDYLAEEMRVKRETDLADAIAAAETGNRQPLYDLADRIDSATEAKVKTHLRSRKGLGDYCLSFDPGGQPDGIIKRATGDVYRVGSVVPVSCLHGEGPAESVCFCAYHSHLYAVNRALARFGFERRVACKHDWLTDALIRRWEKEQGNGPIAFPVAASWLQAFPVSDTRADDAPDAEAESIHRQEFESAGGGIGCEGDRFGVLRHRGATGQGG